VSFYREYDFYVHVEIMSCKKKSVLHHVEK